MQLPGITSTLFSKSMDPAPWSRLCLQLLAGGTAAVAALLSPIRAGIVEGHSMEPTMNPGQFFLYRRATPRPAVPRRGDVVLVELGGQTCVKRVFAVGGDRFWTMRVRNQAGFMGRPLAMREPIRRWKARFPGFHFRQVVVPPGKIFVLGDGARSLDSRELGPVSVDSVHGRVLLSSEFSAEESGNVLSWLALPRKPVPASSSWPARARLARM